jgi:hypothetical protein
MRTALLKYVGIQPETAGCCGEPSLECSCTLEDTHFAGNSAKVRSRKTGSVQTLQSSMCKTPAQTWSPAESGVHKTNAHRCKRSLLVGESITDESNFETRTVLLALANMCSHSIDPKSIVLASHPAVSGNRPSNMDGGQQRFKKPY